MKLIKFFEERNNTRKLILIFIYIIIFIAIFATWFVFQWDLNFEHKIAYSIQIVTLFSTILVALISLLIATPKLKEIIIDFRYEINSSDNESYNIAELPEHLLTHFPKATSCVTSQKISFHLKNISGFDIQNPIFSVRIPRTCLHPSQDGKILECRTNLFNNQNGLSQFDFIDDFIISNNSLPYWNNNEEFILWLRLIINHNDNNELKISINCTNHLGYIKRIKVNSLLK